MPAKFNLDQEDENIKRIIERAATTMLFVSQAYSYCASYFTADIKVSNAALEEPIKFARITQQFFMVIQFCKLFEISKNKKQADSSLFKLNDLIHDKYKQQYSSYQSITADLENIKNSPTFTLFKTLRDKTYAHADDDKINLQLKFRFLTQLQVSEFKDELIKATQVFNQIHHFYGKDLTFHNWYDSSTPKNYLKNHTRNKEFFKKHYKDHLL